jgi:hypothetical protein
MAAIFIFELLHACADEALTTGHKNVIGLRKLGLEQAIK